MRLLLVLALLLPFMFGTLVDCSRVTGRTAGQSIDDATITGEIKGKFIKDPQLESLKIDVDSYEGNVTLAGEVPNKQAEQRAIQIAKQTGGVKSVKSNLLVGGQTTPAGARKAR
jgi:osmotically-inducible protein OsmY